MLSSGNALAIGDLSALKDVLFPDAVGMVLDRRQGWDAVLASMTLTCSFGIEGHINRLRRSSSRCTAADPSIYSAPASTCDHDRLPLPDLPNKPLTMAR